MRDRCSIPVEDKRHFSSLKLSKPAPNPPTFPFSVYWFIGGFSQEREGNHSFPSSIKVKNARSYSAMVYIRHILRVPVTYTVFNKL